MSSSLIKSKPEFGVGEEDLTFRQAANAIFNKLHPLCAVVNSSSDQGKELIAQAMELADAIVHHPLSGEKK